MTVMGWASEEGSASAYITATTLMEVAFTMLASPLPMPLDRERQKWQREHRKEGPGACSAQPATPRPGAWKYTARATARSSPRGTDPYFSSQKMTMIPWNAASGPNNGNAVNAISRSTPSRPAIRSRA